jgi:probable F420-dependent oxidoreductase
VSRFSLVTLGTSLPDQVALAQQTETAGFGAMWASEFYDRSATIPLAAMAAATSTLGLASGVAYAFGRSPLVLAAEARDLDSLSGGRFRLGLGTGTRRMQQDWHGLCGDHPAPRCEELVPLLRRLWRLHEGPVHHEGRFYRTVVVPTAESAPPRRTEIPIYLAGVNARMVEAAGAVADGLLGHPLFTPEYVAKVVRPALRTGAARTERAPELPVAGTLICAVDPDRGRARRAAAAQLAFYLTVKTYDAIADLHGFSDQVGAIRAAWKAGDRQGMAAAVTDEMVDVWALAGPADEVREQYDRRWAGTYEETILYPPNFAGGADPAGILETFAC